MRLALSTVAALAITAWWSASAIAQPTANSEPAAKAEAKDAKAPPKSGKAAPAPKQAEPVPLDLRISESVAAAALELSPARGGGEKTQRITLGDDSSWKVQAVQVGAMVAIFGALAGLCGGGACTIPSAVTNPLPDWLKAKPYEVGDDRAPQEVPNLR